MPSFHAPASIPHQNERHPEQGMGITRHDLSYGYKFFIKLSGEVLVSAANMLPSVYDVT
jgi:hypothetical protein